MFIVDIKILVAVHLKHSSFLPSSDVKPNQNELGHSMHWQGMFAFLCIYNNRYSATHFHPSLIVADKAATYPRAI